MRPLLLKRVTGGDVRNLGGNFGKAILLPWVLRARRPEVERGRSRRDGGDGSG